MLKSTEISKPLPDTITTWQLTGISLSKTHGKDLFFVNHCLYFTFNLIKQNIMQMNIIRKGKGVPRDRRRNGKSRVYD